MIFAAVMSLVINRQGWEILDYIFFALLAFTIALILGRISKYIPESPRVFAEKVILFLAMVTVVEVFTRTSFLISFLIQCCFYGVYFSAKISSREDRSDFNVFDWNPDTKRATEAYKQFYKARFEQEQEEKKRREETRRTEENRRTENKRTENRTQREESPIFPTRNSVYFYDCLTPQEIKERYRELVKKYHPDNSGGNVEIFRKVNEEYEKFEDIV